MIYNKKVKTKRKYEVENNMLTKVRKIVERVTHTHTHTHTHTSNI